MPLELNSPEALLKAYTDGIKGSFFEPAHYEQFMASLKHPYFGAAAPWLKDSGKGKLCTPYKSVMKLCPTAFGDDRQTQPDCVSHSARNAGDITRAVEIDIKKEPELWVARGATEITYGMRGHCGAGMSCSRAADILTKYGFPVRQKYGEFDLSVYDGRKGNKWCPNNVPKALLDLIKTQVFQTVTLIRSVEEARDALANGYGISICSGQGFSSQRDSKGFCSPRGSWSHALTLGGCDDRNNEMDFILLNSWGAWNSGGHPDFGQLPTGGWLAHAEVIAKMIRGGGTFAYSNFDGFPVQNLPDYGNEGLYA